MARFFARLLRVRWAVALRVARRVALELRDAHGRLEPDERARLAELVRRSGGRPQRLSRRERGEVVWLTRKAVGRLT
jgi:hypothetical protein